MFKTPANYLILGKTNTGKTQSFKYLVRQYFCKVLNKIYVFCGTLEFNDDYDYIPKAYKSEDMDIDLIEQIVEKAKIKKRSGKHEQIGIVIDDAIGNLNLRDPFWDRLFSTSRHLNISVFVILQHIKYITPCMRVNIGYILITKVSDNNVDCLFELQNKFRTKREWKSFLDKNCVNYNLIVVDNYDPYKEDSIGIIRPPKTVKKFRLKY